MKMHWLWLKICGKNYDYEIICCSCCPKSQKEAKKIPVISIGPEKKPQAADNVFSATQLLPAISYRWR